MAGTHLAAFAWCCTLLELSFSKGAADGQKDDFTALAAAQARLLASVVAAQLKGLDSRALKMIGQVRQGD